MLDTPSALAHAPSPPSTGAPPFDPASLRWTNRFAALGQSFGRSMVGQALPEPRWLATSASAAAELGWPADWWQHPHALAAHSAGTPWPGSAPMATVYSGHQFGVWAGQLGDGRALLLGEVETPHGEREIQLKGSGMTPYSRMGDGRAVLRSSIREYLCSEAMHGLGIPTTRAMALTGSDLPVRRETVETAAVVTRTAPSFIRFGHFEHFAHHPTHRGDPTALRRLFDFVVDAFYPACRDAPHPAAALLTAVAERTADLLAQWQAVGFCHGVMNTDNLSILGLTIDYGPFGFLDGHDPAHICNHSDHQGRYAFSRQPQVAFWNLHALAKALAPLIELEGPPEGREDAVGERLGEALEPYRSRFPARFEALLRAKIGLQAQRDEDAALIDDWLNLLAAKRVDHTLAWRQLADLRSRPANTDASTADWAGPVRDLFLDRATFDAWAARYRTRLQAESSVDAERRAQMNRVNPRYVLRNHLAELAIRDARAGDLGELHRLARVLERPFDEQAEHAAYAALPPDWAHSLEVSCSS